MKTQDYQSMLRSIEEAIAICDQSTGFMDRRHAKICEDLRQTRARLLHLIEAAKEPQNLSDENCKRVEL